MDDGLVRISVSKDGTVKHVLILIVVDDGLVQYGLNAILLQLSSLNPYCSGRWSRTELLEMK